MCLTSDRCGPTLHHNRFIWADDGQHVTSLVQAAPATFGAAIVFGPPSGGAGAPLDTFELRVNHTAMPSTLATFSDFAIGTVKMTQMPDSDWQAYFWTANLLHAVERSMMARWLDGDNATLPLDVEVNVRALTPSATPAASGVCLCNSESCVSIDRKPAAICIMVVSPVVSPSGKPVHC